MTREGRIDLLGCPFCGKQPILTCTRDEIDDYDIGYTVRCQEQCGIEISDEYRSSVIETWNSRAAMNTTPPAATPGAVPAEILVGGNHLANILIDKLGADFAERYPPDMDAESALRRLHATVEHDVWCCWAAIMRAREAYPTQPEPAEQVAVLPSWAMASVERSAVDRITRALDNLLIGMEASGGWEGDDGLFDEGQAALKAFRAEQATPDMPAATPRQDAAAENWLDPETGTTWQRPTAFAYAQVCKARDKYATLYGQVEKALASTPSLPAQGEQISEVHDV